MIFDTKENAREDDHVPEIPTFAGWPTHRFSGWVRREFGPARAPWSKPRSPQYRGEKMPEQSPRSGDYSSGDDPNPSLLWAIASE